MAHDTLQSHRRYDLVSPNWRFDWYWAVCYLYGGCRLMVRQWIVDPRISVQF